MLENYESPYTATCVQRMLDAGCVPLGKANMDEFCLLYTSVRGRSGLSGVRVVMGITLQSAT